MFYFQRISFGRTLARGYSEYQQSERNVPLIYQAGRRVNNTYEPWQAPHSIIYIMVYKIGFVDSRKRTKKIGSRETRVYSISSMSAL
jgi:hypothetical protein